MSLFASAVVGMFCSNNLTHRHCGELRAVAQ
jgi:hypothetical protein